ncbi:hypothetical protein PSAL_002490 [Pseudooceanicola algae]|uniref:Alpha/beta hydrolase family protein n=2 Tax=Pseudooceanicola algae TaxID=1537215 RepID=A0A418SEY4_9RHOB|nr:hypothetical protein PSAL_002490 [Pseudooceanicola algae]
MNATGTAVQAHGTPRSTSAALDPLVARPGPIVVMVHGYRFEPEHPDHCPHDHIFSEAPDHPCYKAESWPRGLGIGALRQGLAFGWRARGSIWQAHAEAAFAGQALAGLLRRLRDADPLRPIHAIGHSLGARVILSALPELEAGTLDRVLLLAGADYASSARRALDSPAGRRARMLHVTSGENRVYDLMLRSALPPAHPGDLVLGRADLPGLPTLRLDDPRHLDGLSGLGYRVAPPQRRICHWSSYLRPGIFDLYRDLTDTCGAALHAEVSAITAPTPALAVASGWSLPLPWGANAS